MTVHLASVHNFPVAGWSSADSLQPKTSTYDSSSGSNSHLCNDDGHASLALPGFGSGHRTANPGEAGNQRLPLHPGATSYGKRLNNEGGLQRMNDMPLDIIYEILTCLEPLDLLHLARTSRRFREILLSRETARFVWKTVLSNIRGLPPCPPDLTEPQYANLAFDESCHHCSAKGVKDVHWACRVRCCSQCIKKQFVSPDELDCWIPEEVYIQKLASIFPYIVINQNNAKHPAKALFYAPAAKAYLSELARVICLQDEKALDEWLKSKKDNQIERIKHTSLCEHWHNHWAARPLPNSSQIPLFDISVTAVLSSALVYLWKDQIFG